MSQQTIVAMKRLKAELVIPNKDQNIVPESYQTIYFKDQCPKCKENGLRSPRKP
ncbi:hypothetical protein [Ammoniphilus resinae]|uniref:Transposase n=1 Tax=Ammoniphilus resinae TaxID=861532 RepID=A0ABS4GNS0_9BACL|nr:hypothetical protein [Ammoniphilus resinae]MBP1931881.1 hypothetical protein [Ammoniphilus resinae]